MILDTFEMGGQLEMSDIGLNRVQC